MQCSLLEGQTVGMVELQSRMTADRWALHPEGGSTCCGPDTFGSDQPGMTVVSFSHPTLTTPGENSCSE